MVLCSCNRDSIEPALFQKLSSEDTGISFANTITTNNDINYQTDAFIYHGAGVAVGDINNDGLPDIFFSGNEVPGRLYLNKGDMQFEDITEFAGIEINKRATGVSMVDINSNGFLDIYVSISGSPNSAPEERSNMLFINNGDNTFTESAADFNIADPGFGIHAVFFDYNRNGYLDLFVLNNSDLIQLRPTPEQYERGEAGRSVGNIEVPDPYGFDQLYRNNGDGTFTNVSDEAGILRKIGYGLGVVVTDLNGNGWPDIYISNDVTPNDVLYINNQDGTFTDRASDYLKHTSFSGMGIDIADFSNNGWPDILQTDMMSEHLKERKRTSGSVTYNGLQELRQQGYFPHYNLNTLQLNNGLDHNGDLMFSEIALLAGVSYTEWSWSALFGDFDNDGYKDIFITNGYPKAVNDYDYLSSMFLAQQQSRSLEEVQQREFELLENLYSHKVSNFIFRNNGESAEGEHSLSFSDVTEEWGLNDPGFSYGAAYADLNNNGRLDLVINNMNSPAQIYQNMGIDDNPSNYLQIKLEGEYPNLRGTGSKLVIKSNGQNQYIYHTPYRGYMSTMDDRIHFGLSDVETIDSLEILWPDGRSEVLTDLAVNQIITLKQENAHKQETLPQKTIINPLFTPLTNIGLQYEHKEKSFVDFSVQPFLQYMFSRKGPVLATGDVTGNGLDDVYIGGSAGFAGTLFIQQQDGYFVESDYSQVWQADKDFEDWGALFFDANGNGLLDLYVTSGGYHLSPASQLLQDRLYINHGNGRFLKDDRALPQMITSTATVKAADFTGDGQLDLFVGGRLTPRNYPAPVRSYLLQNNGGIFTDITEDAAPELLNGGMITDAIWIDYNANGFMDLVTVGEWTPIEFYENNGVKLQHRTDSMGLPSMRGWWFSIEKGDLNNNGREDLFVGNLGLNFSYTTSEESKFGMYAADFSGNRTTDLIFTKELDGIEYPFHSFAKIGREISSLTYQFKTFKSFSEAPIRQIFTSKSLEAALHFQADTFASVMLENHGNGHFTPSELPKMAQISPINGILTHDFDGDGNLDLIVAGNLYHTEATIPRADAGNGLWLRGDGKGNLKSVPTMESGFYTPLDVKNLALINTANGYAVLVANNSDSLQVYGINP
jgi:enediyne biosynthesis protein E4